MRITITPSINNSITGARTYGIRKANAQEMLKFKEEEVNGQKKVVAKLRSEADKATDGPTHRFLESKLLAAERRLDVLELELKQCREEVHGYKLEEGKARMDTLVENNGTQKAADLITNDVLAEMETEFSSKRS